MTISPRIEKPAFVYQKIVVFRHVPGKALFHARGIGLHWNADPSVVAIPNAATKASNMKEIKRKDF